jgi:hypothetical protein
MVNRQFWLTMDAAFVSQPAAKGNMRIDVPGHRGAGPAQILEERFSFRVRGSMW